MDSGLKDGQEYSYKIKAEDKDHLMSDFSHEITLRTKPKPRPPEELTAVLEGQKAILAWLPNTEADVVSYNIFEKGFFGLTKIGEVREPKATIIGAKSGKSNDYVITAVDRDNLESEPSQPITVFWR